MSVVDLPRYPFARAGSLGELCSLVHERCASGERTVLLAGGTDFMAEVSQSPRRDGPLPLVVDISRLPELGAIEWDGRTLRLGAGATYRELAEHHAVREHAPLIARMTSDIGGPTIQARGTLGGNLATASPAADGVAALAAYEPTVVLASVRGERKVRMADFHTGYKRTSRADDEIITAIEVAPPPPGSPWHWRKVGTRQAQAIAKVALGAVAALDGTRITRLGLGMASVGPTTALLPKTRALLVDGSPRDVDLAQLDAAVAADISPIDDIRSTGAYRLHVAKALVRELVRSLANL